MLSFKLADTFINTYAEKPVNWGYRDAGGNSLGEITFLRTYSRIKPDGSKERWHEVCRRVIEWMFAEQKNHCKTNRLPWNDHKAQRAAQDAYDRMFSFKWTPPGRGLWIAGTPMVAEQRNSAALNNCAFISTGDMTKVDPSSAFRFMMEALMLGVGVGFDDKGADKDFSIYEPLQNARTFVIPDTREGWVDSVGVLLESYLIPDKAAVEFDYSLVRPAGEPIKTFGGTAAGPGPLRELHNMIRSKFDGRAGSYLSRVDIADIGNQIGVCVVSGNVRRSAELLIGRLDDKDFINLKNPEVFPERNHWSADDDGPRGWGWMCVPDDTWVMTDSGPRKVRDQIGVDFKATLSGELHGASGFWRTAESRQVYQLRTRAGYQVEATNNHPVMTKRGWVRMDELTNSDHVLIAHHPGQEWEGDGGSFAEGYLLGAVWSDGWISENRAHIALYGQEFDHGWASYIEECAGVIGVGGTFQQPTARGEHRLASKVLKHFTDRFGFTSDRKPVSESVERMSSDFYCGFLSAALDGDGTIAKYRHGCEGVQVILSQSSVDDLRAIQRMLGRLGIYSTIRPGKVTGFPSTRLPYSLALAARSLSVTTSRLLLKNPRKAARLSGAAAKRAMGQPYWTRVDSVVPGRFAAVYDVTVQDVQRFDANGIVVHNSNNSVEATVESKYDQLVDGIALNGEPGIVWIDVLRNYGRLIDPPNGKDKRVSGVNPCAEISLESGELCTLVECYLNRHESIEDFQRTLKFAYLYAKVVTLLPTHWERTNAIMQRNRRIGCSVSGVANFADIHGLPVLRTWLSRGYETVQRYDEIYSEWLCVRQSIKTTTVKPSGTVSILAGESPGVHWAPGGAYFNRAIRLSKDDALVPLLAEAGYHIESDVRDSYTAVVYFPIHTDARRSENDVTIFEKANLAVVAQRYWSDNSVSVTLSFDAETEAQHVGTVIHMHEGQLKTVSFLPMGNAVYPQQPYTKISAEQFRQIGSGLKVLDLEPIYEGREALDAVGERYCSTDVCEIKQQNLNS